MKFVSGVFVLMLCANIFCFSQSADLSGDEYISKLQEERAKKDKGFKDADTTPLTAKQRRKFKKLPYYKIDESFKVKAKYIEHTSKDKFQMPTSTDRLPVYRRFAMVTFEVSGIKDTLQLYQNVEFAKKPGYERSLFIPFTDKTNGFGSYGGGRYLDVEIPESDHIWIDFNKSYNPYCSYNHNYSCPIPPKENNLGIMILAGERAFDEH